MVSIIYVIVIEAIIFGLMLNRTLYSRTRHMWHLPVYCIVKAAITSYAVHIGMTYLAAPLCMLFSAVYAFLCFCDSIKRKAAVLLCGLLSLAASNCIKFTILDFLKLSQDISVTRNILATVIVLCFVLLFFCLFTVFFTNLMCRVRLHIIGQTVLVQLAVLTFIALIYIYMHSLIPYRYNHLYTVFALFLLLPSVTSLYFSESLVFSKKDNYLKQNQEISS